MAHNHKSVGHSGGGSCLCTLLISFLAFFLLCPDRLIVESKAAEARPPASTFLHENKHLACSACTKISSIIAYALEYPSPELLRQGTVREYTDGQYKYVPYVKSQQYAEDVLEAVCNSSLVFKLGRTEDWLGMPRYETDKVPTFSNETPFDKEVVLACEKLTRRLLRPFKGELRLIDNVKSHGALGAPAYICTNPLSDCRWKRSRVGQLSAMIEQAIHHDRSLLLRHMPLITIFVTAIILIGRPLLGFGRLRPGTIDASSERIEGPKRKARPKKKRT